MPFDANMTEAIKDGVLQYIENVRAGKVDILDVFLVGWVVFTILTVVITSWVTKIITKRRQAAGISGAASGGHVQRQRSVRQDGKSAETCDWVNSTIAWLYMHHSQAPEFVHCWLKALNDQTKKQGSSVQVTFDRIKTGSLPPKISDIRTDAGPRNILTVTCVVEASDVSFVIFATQQTSASVKLSTCDVHVAKLAGQVQCKVACITEEIQVTAMFDGKPELNLTMKPQNSAMDDLVDLVIVENIVRDAIVNAMTTYTLSAKNLPKDIIMSSSSYQTSSSFQPVTNVSRRYQTTVQGDAPNKPPRAHDRRLLVKVIKANGLAGGNGLACGDPYCTIEMDTPVQKHKTATVRNTANPFWDEHFLFDLHNNSDVVKFTVLDRDKPQNDQFLGTAVVSMESLRTNPSTRQIIPLQARNNQDKNITGSITLEFLFMESAEAQTMANQLHPQPSPLRSKYQGTPTKKVETERTVTPTGTVITTVTTTTARPKLTKDRKISGPSLNDVPAQVTKASVNDQSHTHRGRSVSPARDRERNSTNELRPPSMNDSGVSASEQELSLINNTDESVADTAVRHLTEQAQQRARTPTKKSTLIIQGVSRDDDKTPVDELQPPSPSPSPSPTPSPKNRKSRGTSPQRSKRRFFSFGKKDKEKDKDKRRTNSHGDLVKPDKSHTLPSKAKDSLQVPGQKSARSASAGELSINNKHEGRSDTSSLRSTGSRGSQFSYTPNEYSTLVIEALENGRVKHYLIPAALAKGGRYELKGAKLHVYNDHCFVATHFTSVVSCEVCNKTLTRRMGKQGYQCRDCKLVVHKHCHFKTEEHCPNSRVSTMEMTKYSPPPPRRRSLSLGRGRSRSRERRYDHEESSVISEPSSEARDSLKSDPSSPTSEQAAMFASESGKAGDPHRASYTMIESAPPQSLLPQQSSSPHSTASEAYFLAEESNPFTVREDHTDHHLSPPGMAGGHFE